ncbi:MAG: hypothetical protein ABI448_16635 [Bacteroidia bacterium]
MSAKIYLKKMLAAFCLLLTVNCTLAQTQNPLWSLPPNYWTGTLYSLPSGTAANQFPNLLNPGFPWVGMTAPAYNNYASQNQDSAGPRNMYADESGNPLFFAANGFMYNAHGFLIDTLADTLTSIGGVGGTWYTDTTYRKKGRQLAPGWSEICVVPKPGSCKQYYVFTAADNSNNYYFNYGGVAGGSGSANGYKPYFALIDVSQPNPYAPSGTGELGLNITNTLTYYPTGSMTAKPMPGGGHIAELYQSTNTQSPFGAPTPKRPAPGGIQYAATKLIGDSCRFLFVTNDAEIIVYKITATGIHFLYNYDLGSLPTSISSMFNASTRGYNLAELECYVDSANSVIKVAVEGNATYGGSALAFATFGISTGALTSFVNVGSYTRISGVEFSPNGNYVYFLGTSGIVASLFSTPTTYYNIGFGTSNGADFTHSQLELGKDGNLYLIGQSPPYYSTTPRLAKIATPNSPSSALFTDNILNLPSYSYSIKTMHCPYYSGSIATDTTFYLPDQIDQEVYGNQFSKNLACCLFYTPYDRFTYSAGVNQPTGFTGTTQTWSQNTTAGTYQHNPLTLTTSDTVTIGEELRIPAGYTVTINNMKIKFSPQARLIIENANSGKHGGKLILSGCTLTVDNRCINKDMWPGVQIWGIPGNTQSGNSQGYLSATNSVIENAYVGVLAGYDTTWHSTITPRPSSYASSPTNPLGYVGTVPTSGIITSSSGAGGGIVYLSGTILLNNQKGADFYNYSFPTVYSRVTGCTFNNNAALIGGATAIYDMGLYNMTGTGLNVYTTIFEDSYTNYVLTGVYSYNSNYAIQTSHFNNFSYGINGSNPPSSLATISVKNTTFNDNVYGAYLSLINNATITSNDTFRIHQYTCHGHCTSLPSYGIYLDNCNRYDIQDNYLTRFGTSTSNNTFGIIANNSGSYANAIFRNTFDHLYRGCQAQFVNYVAAGGTANGTGLLYQCNTFNSGTITNADIYVPDYNSGANFGTITCPTCYPSGIQSYQGSGGSTAWPPNADNQFSHTGSGAYDFYIDSTTAAISSTYHYLCTACNNPSCFASTNTFYPSKRSNIPATYICTSTVSCSSTNPYSNGYRTSSPSDPTASMISQAEGYKQVYDSLTNLIDGGSTAGLLSLTSGNNNYQAVLNSLKQAIPYISDEVLKAYVNSNYPTSDIVQVLTACSPLTEEVKKTIAASNLSAGIKTQIAALQASSSIMHNFGSLIGAVLASRHLLLNKAIHTLLDQDSIPTAKQQAYNIMRLVAQELPRRVRLETALDLGDTAIAAQELQAVAALEGNTNYVTLHTILANNMGKSPQQILQDPSVRSQVIAIATDSSDRYVYLKANTLLKSIGLSKYVPYIQIDIKKAGNNNDDARVANIEQVSTPLLASLSTLYNQPNPFKESTTIQAHVVEKTQTAFVVVTDMLGAEIARYPVQQGDNTINISAANMAQTVMFCTLVVDGVKIKTNKMVLIK